MGVPPRRVPLSPFDGYSRAGTTLRREPPRRRNPLARGNLRLKWQTTKAASAAARPRSSPPRICASRTSSASSRSEPARSRRPRIACGCCWRPCSRSGPDSSCPSSCGRSWRGPAGSPTPGTAHWASSDRTVDDLIEFVTVGVDDEARARIGHEPEGHGILGLLIREPRPIRVPNIARASRVIRIPPEPSADDVVPRRADPGPRQGVRQPLPHGEAGLRRVLGDRRGARRRVGRCRRDRDRECPPLRRAAATRAPARVSRGDQPGPARRSGRGTGAGRHRDAGRSRSPEPTASGSWWRSPTRPCGSRPRTANHAETVRGSILPVAGTAAGDAFAQRQVQRVQDASSDPRVQLRRTRRRRARRGRLRPTDRPGRVPRGASGQPPQGKPDIRRERDPHHRDIRPSGRRSRSSWPAAGTTVTWSDGSRTGSASPATFTTRSSNGCSRSG